MRSASKSATGSPRWRALPGPVLPARIRAPTWRIAATMIWAAPPSWGVGGITRRCRD